VTLSVFITETNRVLSELKETPKKYVYDLKVQTVIHAGNTIFRYARNIDYH
jgi:hypothetical protein